ncbi:MAG: imidazolonepropionase [Betaproteobacteria bacterium]|nr:imidazolonepropionase [Betaproteobacteria bacterium]
MHADTLFWNVHLATMTGGPDSLGEIPNAALAIKDGCIAWLGPMSELPYGFKADKEYQGNGGWLTPGLIDCHTHLVFAGNRAKEFEQRLQGASYEDIARQGGGILSTVRATRAATESELYAASAERLQTLIAEGVTTLEIKSGYGLELATELKMLRVARALGRRHLVEIKTSFLGAHALPPEFAGQAGDYIDHLCKRMLPAVAKADLADAVDAFCENIAFSPQQIRRVFTAAQKLGLKLKLHAEQLSDQGGAALAADFGALSADHLEYVCDAGIRRMAEAGTVAVLLPGAFYFLRETRLPPIDCLRQAGVPLAVASDLNPGSSPLVSLLVAMHMAATLFRLTPAEVLRGVTVNAAQALGLTDRGTLAVGQRADLALWAVESPAELCYWLGGIKPALVLFEGQIRDG